MSMIIPRQHDRLHCVYFYYLQVTQAMPGQDPVTSTRAYYYFDEDTPIRDEWDLRRIVTKLAENARADDYAPPPCGDSISSAPWRRKSYMVILLDDQNYRFVNKDVLSIVYKDPSVVEEFNHSFFNAKKFDVDLGRDVVTALSCVNLMQHIDNRDMKDTEAEEFSVTFGIDGPSAFRTQDDGGTNQGGPLPPPMFPWSHRPDLA